MLRRSASDRSVAAKQGAESTAGGRVDSLRGFAAAAVRDRSHRRRGAMSPRLLLEVTNCREEAKQGFAPDELLDGWSDIKAAAHVDVAGLMTMARYDDDPERSRPVFRELRELRDRLCRRSADPAALPEVVDGTQAGDFEVAIEEGATLVRIGSRLFEGLSRHDPTDRDRRRLAATDSGPAGCKAKRRRRNSRRPFEGRSHASSREGESKRRDSEAAGEVAGTAADAIGTRVRGNDVEEGDSRFGNRRGRVAVADCGTAANSIILPPKESRRRRISSGTSNMSIDLSLERYSSVADFELVAASRSFDVGQVAEHFIILETACEIPAGPTELFIRLEGRVIRREITLPDGADGTSTRVRISRIDADECGRGLPLSASGGVHPRRSVVLPPGSTRRLAFRLHVHRRNPPRRRASRIVAIGAGFPVKSSNWRRPGGRTFRAGDDREFRLRASFSSSVFSGL